MKQSMALDVTIGTVWFKVLLGILLVVKLAIARSTFQLLSPLTLQSTGNSKITAYNTFDDNLPLLISRKVYNTYRTIIVHKLA